MVQGHGKPDSAIRLALIGCGQIGRFHAQRIVADSRARIVAFCDPLPANAARLQAEFAPDAVVVTTLEELLSRGGIDAAVICTPTHQHFEHVRQCRAAGWHVLCEKPLADTRPRILQLIDEARAGGPHLAVAYQRRGWPVYRTLRREVASGRHGPVRSVTAHVSERWQQTIAGTWRNDPAFNPGGYLGDAGSHKIDMVFFVTGLVPREVFAHSDKRGMNVEIVTTLSARLEHDVALSMSFIGDAQHFREDFQVHCADADLLYRDGQIWIARNNQLERLSGLEPESNPNVLFVDLLRGETPNFAPADVALPVWDLTQATLASARAGQLVRL
ncbi:MAG: Gfo/Idh/MocA family oxidoreductase [Planctomycetes bacterium]|nr:Gfo/Idh/MocA family oxidoreductase [Planctomycetota bacterium]